MRAAAIAWNGRETLAIETSAGYVPIEVINENERAEWRLTLQELLDNGEWERLCAWHREGGGRKLEAYDTIPFEAARSAPLLRQPRKIVGVGMNYIEKLAEMKGNREDADPVLFAKPDTSLIGPGEAIRLPWQSAKVTAEAELVIVIGKRVRDLPEDRAPEAIAGFVCSLDMTAADILAENPRYMFRAKSFDTFCSVGSQILTREELPSWEALEVETALNGKAKHRNTVDRMLYSPHYIISFLSKVMTLLPGDVILTGTPGSVVVSPGDVVACRIAGFAELTNPVAK